MPIWSYLQVLVDTLLAFELPTFEGKLRIRERKRPKLYWVDPGLARAAKRQLGSTAREEEGHLLEGWVAGLLRAYRDYRDTFEEIYYWAPAEASRGRKLSGVAVLWSELRPADEERCPQDKLAGC